MRQVALDRGASDSVEPAASLLPHRFLAAASRARCSVFLLASAHDHLCDQGWRIALLRAYRRETARGRAAVELGRALVEGEQIVVPDTICVGLNEFASRRAFSHGNPGGRITILRVEPVLLVLDKADNVFHLVLPSSSFGLGPTDIRDVLMPTHPVRLVNTINAVSGHVRLSILFLKRARILLFR